MRIHPRLFRALVVRGLAAWLLARLLAAVVLRIQKASAATAATGGSPTTGLWALALAGAILLIDLRRRRELLLLNNLGIATSSAVAIGLGPGLLLELTWLVIS